MLFVPIFAKHYNNTFTVIYMTNSNTIENALLSVLAYPGVCIRYVFYGTKKPIKHLLEDGLDINAFAFLWLSGMIFTWMSILHKF